MPEEPLVLKGIDWKSAFPFTLIFRSFRVAIHPSKLVLALIAVIMVYLGGRVLDAIWPVGSRAVPSEVQMYMASRTEANPAASFKRLRAERRDAVVQAYRHELELSGHPDGDLGDIRADIVRRRTEEEASAREQYNPANVSDAEEKSRVQVLQDTAVAAAFNRATDRWAAAQAYKGAGLFITFFVQQAGTAQHVVDAAYSGHWVGPEGVFDQILRFLTVGPGWAMRHHYVFFTLLGVYALIIWAIFGGAVARIAAVHVARDEKISFRQALAFSSAKFLSFVSAPIIPMAIILGIGFVVFVGALVMNIPFLGPIIGGALFFLALGAGFIMTLVLLGLLGGFNLMYPTIAVEGSDSFDAISRSFSYLFARPWRMGFYTLVAAAYGTICYVFLRYFVMLILAVTHFFVGAGIFTHANSTEPLWTAMWPDPLTARRLSFSVDALTLGPGEYLGAFLVAFWVHLTIAVLAAFLISFYLSSNTIIYVLMRHEVDATEMDDVYLEQTDEEFAESTAPPAPPPVPPAEATAPSGEPTG